MLYLITHYGDVVATCPSKALASRLRRHYARTLDLDYDALLVEEAPADWC
jgi:hypothetical protein